jgi:hypothetical protein
MRHNHLQSAKAKQSPRAGIIQWTENDNDNHPLCEEKTMKNQTITKVFSHRYKSNLFGVILLAVALSTNAAITENNPESKSTGYIAIEYNQGLITATFKQAPFGKAIQALEEKIGVHFEFNSTGFKNDNITAFVDNLSMQEGIRTILYGYSYAIDDSTGKSRIIMLSDRVSTSTGLTSSPP